MVKIKKIILFLVFCIGVNMPYAWGDNGQAVEKLDHQRFNFSNAITGVEYINDWLKSFAELTRRTTNTLSLEEKQQVGNLGAEMQTLAFYNWPKTVEGTLRKQEYNIRKLEYELALERNATGKVSLVEVKEKEKAYQQAQNELEEFLLKFHVAD